MSQDDDLVFNPDERVVPHSMETIRPLGTQAATSVAPAKPISPQSPSTAATPPAIQARPVPPRAKSQLSQAAHQLGRRNIEQAAPQVAVPAARAAAPVVAASETAVLPLDQQVKPEKSVSAAFEDTWLPSNFLPYGWKDIKIRRFSIEELRAVVRARVSGNLRHLVRAVDATISRDVNDLTVGDFWYLMYWHRLNSYKKSPFIIQWTCDNALHQHSVLVGDRTRVTNEELAGMTDDKRAELEQEFVLDANGKETDEIGYYWIVKKDKETLKNLLTVSGSNLETDEIDEDEYVELKTRIEAEYAIALTPQRLSDLIESLEQQEEKQHVRKKRQAAEEKAVDNGDVASFVEAAEEEQLVEDEEQAFMHRYAALLDPMLGATLDERAQFMNSMDPDLLVDLESFLVVAEHGVTESWKVNCKECRASKTVNQSLDALSFLPSLQRGGLA